MTKWNFLIILLLLTSTGWASVKSYFNHNEANTYTDPYRLVERKGDNLEQVILDEIKLAKKSIYVAVQELRLPLIAQALIEKFNKGVDVRIVLEHNYNFNALQFKQPPPTSGEEDSDSVKPSSLIIFVDVNKNGILEPEELETRDAIYMLQQAKVPMIDDTSDGSAGSGLMHHKFLVIDGRRTVISTANFTMSCIHGDYYDFTSRGNANSLIVADSVPLSKIFLEEFSQLWGNGRRGNFGQNKTYRGPQTVTIRNMEITVQFSPTSRRFNWRETVNGLIARYLADARQSVKAALFVFSDQKLANSLQEAQDKGASIGVLVEPKFAWRDYSELLDLLGVRMLGIKCTYEPENNPWLQPAKEVGMAIPGPGDMLHHKFAVVDDTLTLVGSQNWTDSANHNNDETMLVIKDKSISDSYSREYRRIRRTAMIGLPKWVARKITQNEKECQAQSQGAQF